MSDEEKEVSLGEDLEERLFVTKLLKTQIQNGLLSFFTDMFSELNKDATTCCTMYGGYSYLYLTGPTKLSNYESKCDDREHFLTVQGDTYVLNCPLEDTLNNLNIFIASDKDIFGKVNDWLKSIKDKLAKNVPQYKFDIKESISEKAFNVKTIDILIKKGVNLRNKTGKLLFTQDTPIVSVDICTTDKIDINMLKEKLTMPSVIDRGIRTLTKEGYKILNRPFYRIPIIINNQRVRLERKRQDEIDAIYKTEEDILNTVQLCHTFFKDFPEYSSQTSELFMQFLITKKVKTGDISFSEIQSILNTSVLEEKIIDDTYSIRNVINTVINYIDTYLKTIQIGRCLKTGGEAFLYLKKDEIDYIVNDIDAKIFLKGVNQTEFKKIIKLVFSYLFFIIKYVNSLIDQKQLKTEYSFTFAGKEFVYSIDKSFKDFLELRYASNTVNIKCVFDTCFTYEDGRYENELSVIPLDIWVLDPLPQFDAKNSILITDKGKIEIALPDIPVISLDYFEYDLNKSFDDIPRSLSRFYVNKLGKDLERQKAIKRKREDVEDVEVDNEVKVVENVVEDKKSVCLNITNFLSRGFFNVMEKCKDVLCSKSGSAHSFFKQMLYVDKTQLNAILGGDIRTNVEIIMRYCTSNDIFSQFVATPNENGIRTLIESYTNTILFGLSVNESISLLLLYMTKINQLEYTKYGSEVSVNTGISCHDMFMEWYTSNTLQYKELNRKLREHIQLSYIETIVRIKLIELIDTHKPVTAVLYRGIDKDLYSNLKMGDMIHIPYFLSTSKSKLIAKRFTKGTCCMLKINVNGIKGIYTNSKGEEEIIFMPGVALQYKETYINMDRIKEYVFELIDSVKAVEEKEDDEKNEESFIVIEHEQQEMNDPIPSMNEIDTVLSILKNIDKVSKETFKEEISKLIQFMKMFTKEKINITTNRDKIIDFIELFNERKYIPKHLNYTGYNYHIILEKEFGKFCLTFLKSFDNPYKEIDFLEHLNRDMTLERPLSGGSTIRQLFNTFISTTNAQLHKREYGTLYKTGGESIRYYTKELGDIYSNDIDSKWCHPETDEKGNNIVRKLFPTITTSILILANFIKSKMLENGPKTFNNGSESAFTVSYYTIQNAYKVPIEQFMTVRTNFVGKCGGPDGIMENGESKDHPECMRIISIDINYKVSLIIRKPIDFYVSTAPYDFLISNDACISEKINMRKYKQELPPVVSLLYIVDDLVNLFTPPSQGSGDLQRRYHSGKHGKDVKRFNAILTKLGITVQIPEKDTGIYENDLVHNENRAKVLTVIKEKIGTYKDIIDINKDNERIDQPCDNTICSKLKDTIDYLWDNKYCTIPYHITTYLMSIHKIKTESTKMGKILNKNPWDKVFVPIK